MKIIRTCLLWTICIFLVACGPSQAELDAQATAIAADIFATQTAQAPTITPTPELPTATPTPTETPPPTDTPTPLPITDTDFTELAQETCESLKTELASITKLNAAYVDRYYMASEAYERAADGLVDIEMSKEFAPMAIDFRTSLFELADIYKIYHDEYFNALQKIDNYETAKYIATTEEGETYIFIDEWIKVDIDTDLINQVLAAEGTFKELGKLLGLTSCIEVDPIRDDN